MRLEPTQIVPRVLLAIAGAKKLPQSAPSRRRLGGRLFFDGLAGGRLLDTLVQSPVSVVLDELCVALARGARRLIGHQKNRRTLLECRALKPMYQRHTGYK